jgi:hypothetical protein
MHADGSAMSETANLKLEYRDDSLIIQAQGRDIIDNGDETMRAMAAVIKARPVRATLIDVRLVPGPLTFINRYQLGKVAGQYLAGLRVGCLMYPDQADPQRIGQLAARNRGALVEIFTDPTEAEEWLKTVPALVKPPA